jgi:hypothetical protein
MRKIIPALVLSVLCTGWGWGTPDVPACSDEGTNEQLSALMLEKAGLQSLGDGKYKNVLTGGTHQLQLAFSLHRETSFENNIRHCQVEAKIINEDKDNETFAARLPLIGLYSLEGTIEYTIQLTDDGTALWTAAIGE